MIFASGLLLLLYVMCIKLRTVVELMFLSRRHQRSPLNRSRDKHTTHNQPTKQQEEEIFTQKNCRLEIVHEKK